MWRAWQCLTWRFDRTTAVREKIQGAAAFFAGLAVDLSPVLSVLLGSVSDVFSLLSAFDLSFSKTASTGSVWSAVARIPSILFSRMYWSMSFQPVKMSALEAAS